MHFAIYIFPKTQYANTEFRYRVWDKNQLILWKTRDNNSQLDSNQLQPI